MFLCTIYNLTFQKAGHFASTIKYLMLIHKQITINVTQTQHHLIKSHDQNTIKISEKQIQFVIAIKLSGIATF